MTLQDIETHPQVQGSTWDLQSIQNQPRETLRSSTQVTARQLSYGSSTSSPVSRMPLGPTGAALLQTRARNAEQEHRAHETVKPVQPMKNRVPDRSKFQPMENQQGQQPNTTPPREDDIGRKHITTRWIISIHSSTRRCQDFFQKRQMPQVPQTHLNGRVAGGRQEAQSTATQTG